MLKGGAEVRGGGIPASCFSGRVTRPLRIVILHKTRRGGVSPPVFTGRETAAKPSARMRRHVCVVNVRSLRGMTGIYLSIETQYCRLPV